MAGITFGSYVLTQQHEFSVSIVIEFARVPLLFSMARSTFFAQSPFMCVIITMTGNTTGGSLFLVYRSFMACNASDRHMFPQQFEWGLAIMIEIDRFPVFFNMAGIAFLAVCTLMFIDCNVTGDAFM